MVGHVFLGQYEVVRPLGEGSMGQVFLARQQNNGRQVAVKVLHDYIATDQKFRELFEREMHLMTRFQHPNIVAVYEASAEDPNGLCMIMEYVPGVDMEELLKKGRIPVERTGRLLGQLCAGLQAAHGEGIIHRDLKPANLMIMDAGSDYERLKVMDFGLAKVTTSIHISIDKLKGNGGDVATGTAEYMAPEQVRGDELDHRSDIYSVGCLLFEMMTGQLPFQRDTIPELLEAHAEDVPPRFADVGVTDLPPAVEKVVMWCLSKYPVERPQSAWDLAKRWEGATGDRILTESAPPSPSGILRSGDDAPPLRQSEGAVVHELEAFMPERIAVVKLRGYVDDVGGEMVESVPGMIRVRFGQKGCQYQCQTKASGALSWIGLSGPKNHLISVELRMRKVEGGQSSQLKITMLIKPEAGGKAPDTPLWKACCMAIYKDLKAYLMGK